MTRRAAAPGRDVEDTLLAEGRRAVAGIDEVGRGAWAGPLVVGVVVAGSGDAPVGVRDSKQLSATARERLFPEVLDWCAGWAVGEATPGECDDLGMAAAQRLAVRRAIDRLVDRPDAAIVDGSWDFVGDAVDRVEMRVGADRLCASVAAASIVAKVIRDRAMRDAAVDHPCWSFESNKGYPCAQHRAALAWCGPSVIHRQSWVFMDHYVPWSGVHRLVRPAQPSLF